MDITAGIVIFQLKKLYQLDTNISMKKMIQLKGFRIWAGESPQENFLYICSEKLPEGKEWRRKVCIGIHCEEQDISSQPLFISVKDDIDLYQLINSLQEIFQRFSNWKARMEHLFYHYENYETILNELEREYGLISILVDKDLKYMAMSDSYPLYNDTWLGDTGTMSLELVNDLMTDQKFRNAIYRNKTFQYCNTDSGDISYCYNIKIEGNYEARLLIQNMQKGVFFGGLDFAEYIGEHLKEIFVHYNEEEDHGIVLYEFYNVIKDLLNGIPRSVDEIRQCLNVRGWERNHVYQVYLFQFRIGENTTVTRQYYQREIERLFKNCCVLAEGERLCCIRNLSGISKDAWDVRQELSVFLRENLCKTGISQQFEDISQLRSYYLEAENALLLGMNSQSTWWYYSFENMVLPYIWSQASKEIDAHQLYHPAIRTLLAYDKKENSEMVKTVYEYMKHRYNATQTARVLFIHRTSLLFRLERIEHLAGIDWNNWNDRIHLAITFELMKQNGEYGEDNEGLPL